MKRKLAVLASLLGLFFGVAPVWAGMITFNFSDCGTISSPYTGVCPGDLKTSQATFNDSTHTYQVAAYGVNNQMGPIDLYVKNGGAGENGLGVSGTFNDELNRSNGVILDMTDLAANGIDVGTFTLSSLQFGEVGAICSLSDSYSCQPVFESGRTASGSASVTWSQSNPYLLFYSPSYCTGNFLINSLTAQSNSVPEPGSAVLFGFGLAALGLAISSRKRSLG